LIWVSGTFSSTIMFRWIKWVLLMRRLYNRDDGDERIYEVCGEDNSAIKAILWQSQFGLARSSPQIPPAS
jgi:hypothetical protein